MEIASDNGPFIFASQHLLILTNKKLAFHFAIFLIESIKTGISIHQNAGHKVSLSQIINSNK